MLQLLRFLIFGKQCQHEWECYKSLTPYSNSEKHIYLCQKCGKIKVVKLEIILLNKKTMSELELRQIFKNQSDCYADTRITSNGIITEGPFILAMTEDKFIEVLMNAKMIDNPSERPNVCFQVKCTYCRNDECHISESDNQSIRKMMDDCIYRITKK